MLTPLFYRHLLYLRRCVYFLGARICFKMWWFTFKQWHLGSFFAFRSAPRLIMKTSEAFHEGWWFGGIFLMMMGLRWGQGIGKSMGFYIYIYIYTFSIFFQAVCIPWLFAMFPWSVWLNVQELSQIKALHGALVQRFAESHVRLLVLVDLQDSEQDLMTQELGRASWHCLGVTSI